MEANRSLKSTGAGNERPPRNRSRPEGWAGPEIQGPGLAVSAEHGARSKAEVGLLGVRMMEFKEHIAEMHKKKNQTEQKIEAAIEEFHREGLMEISSIHVTHVYAIGKQLPERTIVSLSLVFPKGGEP